MVQKTPTRLAQGYNSKYLVTLYMFTTEPDLKFVNNERIQNQKAQKEFVEQNIEDIIEGIQMDSSKTDGHGTGTHFANGVTTTDTVSLRLNIFARISDVTKAMDATLKCKTRINLSREINLMNR